MIQSVVVMGGVGILLVAAVGRGDALVSVPAFAAALAVPYVVRGFLVDRIEVVRRLMTVFAVAGILSLAIARRRLGSESLWLWRLVITLATLYVSSYFWVMSDEGIVRRS